MVNSLNEAARNASLSGAAVANTCRFCGKQGLLILPLLYAACPKSAAAPGIPGHLGQYVKDIPLGQSSYTLRMTRSGYWYLLVNRLGHLSWQCYASSAQGYVAEFAADTPPLTPPEFTCERNGHGMNASMLAVARPDQVETAYLLFSPDPLTLPKLAEIKGRPEALCDKGLMVKLQPKAWQSGQHTQANCLDATAIGTSVAEFVLAKKSHEVFSNPLAKALANGTYPLMSDGDEDKPLAVAAMHLSRLESVLHYMANNKAVGVVAYDPIGVTQALNDHRNDALNKVNDFLNTPDKEGQTNRWKFDALRAINEVKAGFEKGLVSDAMHSAQWAEDNLRAHHEPIFPDDTPEMCKLKLSWNNAVKDYDRKTWPQRNPNKSAELEAALAQARADYPKDLARAKDLALHRWHGKYLPLLDAKAMGEFEAKFDTVGKAAMAEAERRVDDHLAWVVHDRYVDAFDIYDRKNMVSGLRFERQSALCTLGMTGIEKCAKQVDAWLTLPVTERKNIYMRGLLLNQDDIEKEAAKALAEAEAIAATAPTVAAISGDKMYKALKGLIGFFKSADAAFDEFLRNSKDGQTRANFNESYEAGKLYKFAEINRSIFRAGITTLEMNHVGRVVGLALARLGGVTEHVVVDELLKGIDPQSPHPDTPLHPTKPAFNPNNKPTTTVDVPVRANVSPAHAARTGKQVAQQIEPELRALMTDAQAQHQARVQGVTYDIDEYLTNNRTNNYHQARIGILLSVLETIALGSKVWGMRDGKVSRLQVIEASANIMSIVNIGYDIAYATTKSVREQTKDTTIKGAGDVVRGGYKMWAGAFGAVAGGLGIWADFLKLEEEQAGANRFGQKAFIGAKLFLGSANTFLGVAAAFSYSGPMLRRVEINLAMSATKKRVAVGGAARVAEWLAKRVLLLRLVAWGSGAGWALTAGEIAYYGYLYLQPSELEVWAKRCAFRNVRLGSQPYLSREQEIEELAKARKLAKV